MSGLITRVIVYIIVSLLFSFPLQYAWSIIVPVLFPLASRIWLINPNPPLWAFFVLMLPWVHTIEILKK